MPPLPPLPLLPLPPPALKKVANGKPHGLPSLFCIPILFKDNYDAVGMPNTNGAKCFQDNFPKVDATQVMQVGRRRTGAR